MAKTREQKELIVNELVEKFKKIKSIVFTSISGFTMPDADKLRAAGRQQDVGVAVTKKTLLNRALKEAGLQIDVKDLPGSVLTTMGFSDEVAAAKIVAALAKEKEGVKFVGGVLEGKLMTAEAVAALSKLPGKQELLAKVVGSLNAPVSGFVNVLSGNLRKFVYALNAIKESKT
jgi:large subunit ribosomal protein L10